MRKKLTFDQLKLHPPYRMRRRHREGVIGHDTESLLSGYSFLWTDSLGNYSWIHSADNVVNYLTDERYSKSFNTFWNMDFDVTVLLKWLGREFCGRLVENGKADYEGVYFEYVPKRYMMVRRGNVWNTFFDASQYFVPRSLDGASKKYLGTSKKHVGSKEFTEADYDREDLLAYCLYDSVLCRDLTLLLLEDLREMGFDPTTLASPGTIAEEALVGVVYLPDVTKIPRGALEYAFNSYKGGWMECFKRGYFPKLWDYDVSSAYPYQIANLVDLNEGSWHYFDVERGDSFDCADYKYAFLHCEVDIASSVSPIIYQADVNVTPKGRWLTYLTLGEVLAISAYKLGRVRVLDGWFFKPSLSAVMPFKYSMKHLFRQKMRLKNAWLPKAMSVSLYGKLSQKFDDGRTGNLFNPPYASVVTSETRLQIARFALMLPERLVVVATDGLTFSAPLSSLTLAKRFGGLRRSHCDEGVVVGTNVFTIRGKDPGGAWRPGRYDWLRLFREHPTESVFSLKQWRYVTLAEGVVGNWEEVGQFKDFPYDFNINFDHKRVCHKVSCAQELMENQFDCYPWEVGVVKRREELWKLE